MDPKVFDSISKLCRSFSTSWPKRKIRGKRSRKPSVNFGLLESRQLLAGLPVISEFLASNDGSIVDEDGASSDWIEIFNAGDEAVDLNGWSLTDDADELTKWTFPATTLEPSEFLLVFASGKDRAISGSELHSNFKLKASGEYLALVEDDGSSIAFEYAPEYPLQLEDVSFGLAMEASSTVLVDDTTLVRTLVPSDDSLGTNWTNLSFDDSNWVGAPDRRAGVGFENSPDSEFSYTALINAPVPVGSVSAYARFEFQLTSVSDINQLSLAMQFDDGFVGYLNGVKVASRNAPTSPVWNSLATSGTPDERATDPINFDLTDRLNELVVGTNVLSFQLLNRTVGSSDLLLIPKLTAVQSSLAEPQAQGFFASPTPGQLNGNTAQGFTTEPTFSVSRGFYDASFSVTLATDTPAANIYYTTNGSDPNATDGTLYTGPITINGTTPLRAVAIKDSFFPSPSVTHTYLFASDIISQSSSPNGYPADWGTHNNHTNGNTPFLAIADYEIDPDVVGPNALFDGKYTSRFDDALTSLPTLSLTMDIDDAFDGETGFYANSLLTGREWERGTSVEWWDPAEEGQFQVNAGIRAHGGAGRQPWRTPKHAMRLYFRNDYGPGRLNFPLFGEESVTRFDRLVLRSHYNDSWYAVSSALHNRAQYTQDPFVRNSFADMGNLSVRSRPVNVYINGLYWGVYDVTERPDSEYFADHLGGDAEDYDVITHGGLADGNRTAWDNLFSFVRTTDLSTSAGYEAVKEQLDVQSLADYMLVNFFAGVDDWPHNNWVTAANRVDGGGFKFYVWDAEISMNQLGANRTEVDDANSPAELYDRLRVNSEFRDLFAYRVLLHMSEGGALSPENTIQRYSALADRLEPALVAESARWGDVHETTPRTPDEQWRTERDWVLNTYLPQRTDIVRNQLLADGLASNFGAVVNQGLAYGGTTAEYGGDTVTSDKVALLPGETATFANYSSYVMGINRVAVDFLQVGDLSAISTNDFVIETGNGSNHIDFTAYQGTFSVSAFDNGGVNRSDRIVLTFPDGEITNTWLKVTVNANSDTNLEAESVFYFGNAIGETGGSDASVSSEDVLVTRANRTGPFNPAAQINRYDFDRSGSVDSVDVLIARQGRTNPFSELALITAPTGTGSSSLMGFSSTGTGGNFASNLGLDPVSSIHSAVGRSKRFIQPGILVSWRPEQENFSAIMDSITTTIVASTGKSHVAGQRLLVPLLEETKLPWQLNEVDALRSEREYLFANTAAREPKLASSNSFSSTAESAFNFEAQLFPKFAVIEQSTEDQPNDISRLAAFDVSFESYHIDSDTA